MSVRHRSFLHLVSIFLGNLSFSIKYTYNPDSSMPPMLICVTLLAIRVHSINFRRSLSVVAYRVWTITLFKVITYGNRLISVFRKILQIVEIISLSLRKNSYLCIVKHK